MQRYDDKMTDVFQIQSDIAESVAENLKITLLADERARVERRPTQNLEAYNLFLLGNYYFLQEHRHSALSTESQSVPREEDAVVLVSDLRKQAG